MSTFLATVLGGAVGAVLVLAVLAILVSAVGPWLPIGEGDPYEGDADELEVRRRG